jgi:TonB-dependent SusC/RagA subfamily outer membrane receptor
MKTAVVIMFLLLAAGSAVPSVGQTGSNRHFISGYVTDMDYYPVVGALIMVDNKNTDITTDDKGYYRVRIPRNIKSIGVYSFTYGMIEESVNGRTRINFRFSASGLSKLPQDDNESVEDDDKVNIGYSKVNRRNLTTSVSTLDATDSRFSTYTSIYEMMKGTLPGVLVNGDRVLVRGYSSLFGSNEPLYVVDGVPVNTIDDLSPRLVKSIGVLKGPAAAIYGSRGANGVILIDLIEAPDIEKETPVDAIRVPFVDTYQATDIKAGSATLNGLVNPNDKSAVVMFEYIADDGTEKNIVAGQSPLSGDSSSVVSAVVEGLVPGTLYHYRVAASNSFGTEKGVDVFFTTPGGMPEAETGSVNDITPGSAKLNGIVNSNHLSAEVYFEYGTDTTYGSRITLNKEQISGNSADIVNAEVKGLKAGTTYHYRIVVSNEKGIAFGNDRTFVAQYELGELIHGGYIFYIDGTGSHGLVCSASDLGQNAVWGYCTPEGAESRDVGSGSHNTVDIVNGCNDSSSAAGLCHNLELNGYSDWFLPSVNELQLIYRNLHEKGIGGFSETYYWSSTQDKFGAWVVNFYYGNKSNQNRDKQGVLVRPVRAF